MTPRKADARDRILNVAIDLYMKTGLRGISMRRIAKHLRLTPMALYRHFKNKEALLVALVEKGFMIFGDYQMRALSGKTAAERMLLAGQSFLDFTLEKPRFFKVIFMAPEIFAEVELPDEIAARVRQTYQFLLDRVAESMREGFLKQGDAEATARTIWGLSHGLGSLYLSQMLDTDEAGFRGIFMEAFRQLGDGIFIDAASTKYTA